MLTVAGTESTNVFAASFAACNRFGSMSVASIDTDVSMATAIDARPTGTWTARVGSASATTRRPAPTTKAAAVTWRRHAGRFGATTSSSARFVNRMAYTGLRSNWNTTYATRRATTASNNHRRPGARNSMATVIRGPRSPSTGRAQRRGRDASRRT